MARKFQKLTAAAVRNPKQGTTITEHGISFQRLQNGDGVYTVNVMVDGQRIHRVIGRESEGVTREKAVEFIEQARTDARHGRLNLPKRRKTVLRFREAAGRYLEKLAEEGGKDLTQKRRRLDLHLSPFFGDTPISDISGFDVERYKKHRLQEPALHGGSKEKRKNLTEQEGQKLSRTKPGTVNRELAALSHLLNKAVEWGWMSHRPARIRRLQENAGRITYLTVEQVESLKQAALADTNMQVYPFIVIGLETSMRRMEILGIRREHIALDRLTIHIPKAKAGAREQPMTSWLVDYLREYIKTLPAESECPWLFPSAIQKKGQARGHAMSIEKAFRRVVAAAGMDPKQIVRHTLRHTAITHLVQAGVDLPTVKRISGHKTLAMVERYAHANGAHIQAAMDKLGQRYKAASGG